MQTEVSYFFNARLDRLWFVVAVFVPEAMQPAALGSLWVRQSEQHERGGITPPQALLGSRSSPGGKKEVNHVHV